MLTCVSSQIDPALPDIRSNPTGNRLVADSQASKRGRRRSTMYGLILQNMAEYIRNKFGDNMWGKVKEQLNLEQVCGYLYMYGCIYKYTYIYTRADTGGGIGDCPPLSNFRVGTVPPLKIVPRLSNSGGGQPKSPPLSDSGGGQRFFS